MHGTLELTKIANGIVLYGNIKEYDKWVEKNLNEAILGSKTLWLATLIGMQLSCKKYGVFLKRFKKSLNELFSKANLFPFNPNQDISDLKITFEKSLDEDIPDWRNKTIEGIKIFKIQIPEQWNALNIILK